MVAQYVVWLLNVESFDAYHNVYLKIRYARSRKIIEENGEGRGESWKACKIMRVQFHCMKKIMKFTYIFFSKIHAF